MGTTQTTTRVGCPEIAVAHCQGDSAETEGFFSFFFFLIEEERLTWAYKGVQLGMDFSNLLLVVKGEWSHTGMDETCLCVMK